MAILDGYLSPQPDTTSKDQYYFHKRRLQQTVKELGATIIVEAGTNIGRSTRIWAEALEATNGHLWTIDIASPLEEWLLTYPLAHRITFIQQDILHVTWRDDRPIDILYLDDAHTYPHVLYELRRWAPFVRVGGRIFLDDVQHSDWVSHEPNTAWQITKSVAEFCREATLPYLVHTGNQGMAEIVLTHPVRSCHGATHQPTRDDDP